MHNYFSFSYPWDKRGPSHFSSGYPWDKSRTQPFQLIVTLGLGPSEMTAIREAMTGSRELGLVLDDPCNTKYLYTVDIRTILLVVCCERSSACLRRTFEAIFARNRDEVHLSALYLRIVLADPYSSYSALGSLGRARTASRWCLLFSILFDPTP